MSEEVKLNILTLEKPYNYVAPTNANHAILFMICDEDISPEKQSEISDKIVESNCVYFMAWGYGCSSWDDSVDLSFVTKQIDSPDKFKDKFVMTTWHENETVEEVFYFLDCFVHDAENDQEIENKYIVFLGASDEFINKCEVIMTSKNYLKDYD